MIPSTIPITMLTYLQLHGAAAAAAKQAGVKQISVSISHSDSQAVAVAVSHIDPRDYIFSWVET